MTLTKAHIADRIQKEIGISKADSANLVETILKLMKDSLASGEDVLIPKFGKFCVKKKEERIGRNPATDDVLVLKKRKVATFKCSGKLRKKINNKK